MEKEKMNTQNSMQIRIEELNIMIKQCEGEKYSLKKELRKICNHSSKRSERLIYGNIRITCQIFSEYWDIECRGN